MSRTIYSQTLSVNAAATHTPRGDAREADIGTRLAAAKPPVVRILRHEQDGRPGWCRVRYRKRTEVRAGRAWLKDIVGSMRRCDPAQASSASPSHTRSKWARLYRRVADERRPGKEMRATRPAPYHVLRAETYGAGDAAAASEQTSRTPRHRSRACQPLAGTLRTAPGTFVARCSVGGVHHAQTGLTRAWRVVDRRSTAPGLVCGLLRRSGPLPSHLRHLTPHVLEAARAACLRPVRAGVRGNGPGNDVSPDKLVARARALRRWARRVARVRAMHTEKGLARRVHMRRGGGSPSTVIPHLRAG